MRVASAATKAPQLEDWANDTALVNFDIDGPHNGKPLKALCDKTSFVPGRWVACDSHAGGVGNVRDSVLACLRYSIAAGAGWVMPTLDVRGQIVFGEEFLHQGGKAGLDFMWDVDYLKASLKEFCPEMAVVAHASHVPGYTFANFTPPLNPLELHPIVSGVTDSGDHAGWPHQQNLDSDSFRHDFDAQYPPPDSAERPTVVRLSKTIWQWIIQRDPFEFWSTFGRVLRFRQDVQILASQVWRELEGRGEGVFGMHLRFEDDVAEGWGTFDELTNPYIDKLLERGNKLVYVACGDQSILARFEQRLAERAPGVEMTTKYSLLAARPLSHAKLASMPFDQQALIDYLILLKSDYFTGTSFSSFSANIGARRHLLTKNGNARKILTEDDDGLSMLRESSWLWTMREVMWP